LTLNYVGGRPFSLSMPTAFAKNAPTEILDTFQEADTDARRRARVVLAHRRALFSLARVTLRYQVHNELEVARRSSEESLCDSETRMRARARRISAA